MPQEAPPPNPLPPGNRISLAIHRLATGFYGRTDVLRELARRLLPHLRD